ncbi:MAG TPA: peptidase MA family metallohydrolase [Candidatus Omnitrophota bacterium]|nr:peptidase MA family metallohydrolase [Candidatus Omnitrophota bacterium]
MEFEMKANTSDRRLTIDYGVFLVVVVSSLLFMVYCPSLCATEESFAGKREKTQYERRLDMLAQRYSRAPAGTVDFPKELMAIDYINEGYSLFQKSEYDLALKAAEEALKCDIKSPVAHELSGDIYYLKQNLVKANEHYREAFKLEPVSRLKDKLEKLTRETEVEKSFDTVEEEHFLIKYSGNQNEYEGFELKTMLRDTYREIAKELAHYLNHKTTVLFYDADKFHAAGNLAHWIGGLYDGKVRLPVHPRGFGEKQLRAVARHELTHVFLDDLGKKKTPIWLHEGFAVYQQNKIEPLPVASLRVLKDESNLIPLHSLFNPTVFESHKNDEQWMGLFYMQSYDVVDYIIGRYGVFYLKQMAIKFSEEKNAEQVISETLKISIEKLEKEWKASLASAFL